MPFSPAYTTSKSQKRTGGGCGFISIILGLTSGFCTFGSYYIRPAYILSAILLTLITIVLALAQKKFLFPFFFLLGAFLVAFPQIIINQNNFHTSSPLIQSSYGNYPSLAQFQFDNGLKIERTDLNLGSHYPSKAVLYLSPSGNKLASIINTSPQSFSYLSFFSLAFSHPIDFFIVQFKHLFNGLDQKYPELCLALPPRNTPLISWLNYTLIFLTLFYTLFQLSHHHPLTAIKKNWRQKNYHFFLSPLLLLALLAPLIPALFSAVETRFFLPAYILIYAVTVFAIPYKKIWLHLKPRWPLYLLIYLLFLALCFALSHHTFSHLEFPLQSSIS